MGNRQQGMTFIGLLFVLALVGIIGYAGIRLVPVYLNYMKVSKIMEATATELQGSSEPGNIKRTLEKHWQIDDPSAPDLKDFEITKDDSGAVIHVAYDDKVPYISDISLSVHFDKTVKVK
jgi:Tfp pilus assembly protein PilE